MEKGYLYKLKDNIVICVKDINITCNDKRVVKNLLEHKPLDGYANCIIVKGNDTYPVGGYDISVPFNELTEENRIIL